ncbi:MAG TPA: phosphoribosyltransferase family protein [Candidatus Sulfotelmatobacter sp.]|nr:phosphoribosyltransferase family protein [Candidatus Sulfotelmatobacter sp.]
MRRLGFSGEPLFADRRDAGRHLAARLAKTAADRPIVVGLPRGGVIVAAEVAAALGAPLDLLVVRKLGVPEQPELALGAIAEGGVRVLNDDVLLAAGIRAAELDRITAREQAALADEVARYRRGRPAREVVGRPVIVVDDGLATGATARVALAALRERGAGPVTLAVPVAPRDTVAALAALADDLLVLTQPRPFFAVGTAYIEFGAATDADVMAALDAGRRA